MSEKTKRAIILALIAAAVTIAGYLWNHKKVDNCLTMTEVDMINGADISVTCQ